MRKNVYVYTPRKQEKLNLCPLEANNCGKQITIYPNGIEEVYCCDGQCTNPNGQIKQIEQRENNVLNGAHQQ